MLKRNRFLVVCLAFVLVMTNLPCMYANAGGAPAVPGANNFSVTPNVLYDDFNDWANTSDDWTMKIGNNGSNGSPPINTTTDWNYTSKPISGMAGSDTVGGKTSGMFKTPTQTASVANRYAYYFATWNDAAWANAWANGDRIEKLETKIHMNGASGVENSSTYIYNNGMTQAVVATLDVSGGKVRLRMFPIGIKNNGGTNGDQQYTTHHGIANIQTDFNSDQWLEITYTYNYHMMNPDGTGRLCIIVSIVPEGGAAAPKTGSIYLDFDAPAVTANALTGRYSDGWKVGISSGNSSSNAACYDSFRVTFSPSLDGTFESDDFSSTNISKALWRTEAGNRRRSVNGSPAGADDFIPQETFRSNNEPTINYGCETDYLISAAGNAMSGSRISLRPAYTTPQEFALITTIKDDYWPTIQNSNKRITQINTSFSVTGNNNANGSPFANQGIYAYRQTDTSGKTQEALVLAMTYNFDATNHPNEFWFHWNEFVPQSNGTVSRVDYNFTNAEMMNSVTPIGTCKDKWLDVTLTYTYDANDILVSVKADVWISGTSTKVASSTRTTGFTTINNGTKTYRPGWKAGFASSSLNSDYAVSFSFFEVICETLETTSFTVSIPSGIMDTLDIGGNLLGNVSLTQNGLLGTDTLLVTAQSDNAYTGQGSYFGILLKDGVDAGSVSEGEYIPYKLTTDSAGETPFAPITYTSASTANVATPLYAVIDQTAWSDADKGWFGSTITFTVSLNPAP